MNNLNQGRNQKPQFYFLLILLALTLVLSYFILRPFLVAFTLAIVFSVLFQPLYRKILKHVLKQEALSALLTIAVIMIIIFTPFMLIRFQMFNEAKDLYKSLAAGGGNSIINFLNGLALDLHERFPAFPELTLNFDQHLQQILSWLVANLGVIFSNFASILATAFLFLISLYYLLKDGLKLRKKIIALSPLNDMDDEIIINKLEMAMSSVVKGNFLIAIIQGVLAAIGFAIFGVPNFFLWGAAAAIAALIPTVGTSLVFIPTVVFLLVGGEYVPAIGLAIWGLLAVGLIDNLLGPKLMGRGMQLHPLLILFSVLGGLAFFGPIGLLLGPIILSLFFALWDILSLCYQCEK